MTEVTRYDGTFVAADDPTGGRLVAWALAAKAAHQLAVALSETSFVPAAFAGNPGDATAAILMGDELGLSPIAALRSLFVIHSQPALYARAMVALAQSHGHEIWTELSTSERVVVCGKRRGSQHVEKADWTMARARQANYTTNKKYATNPIEMLYSKAAAEVARKVAADVLAGVPYSVEDIELDDGAAESTVTVQREKPKTVRRKVEETVVEPSFDEPESPVLTDPEMAAWAEDIKAANESDVGLDIDPITKPQLAKLQILMKEAGIEDREQRLDVASKVIDRHIDSSTELSKGEASAVIESLISGAWTLV